MQRRHYQPSTVFNRVRQTLEKAERRKRESEERRKEKEEQEGKRRMSPLCVSALSAAE